jgi:hypothetical protein
MIPTFHGAATVTAKADNTNHNLVSIFDSIPGDVRKDLEDSYGLTRPEVSLRDTLSQYEGLFAVSRYPFEKNKDIKQFTLLPLRELCTFLRDFIKKMESIERIIW